MWNLRCPGLHPEEQGVTVPEVCYQGAARPLCEWHPDSIKACRSVVSREKRSKRKEAWAESRAEAGVEEPAVEAAFEAVFEAIEAAEAEAIFEAIPEAVEARVEEPAVE